MTWSKAVESLCAGVRPDEDGHRRTKQGLGGEHVHGEQGGDNPAFTELRARLAEGLALARLNQTQLAKQAELGRTTVSEALSPTKPVPSAETVAALARVLKLPVQELLELRRTAVEEFGHGHLGWAEAPYRGVGAARSGGSSCRARQGRFGFRYPRGAGASRVRAPRA
ncbi:helix-turn-helix transcriptional regulator [Streptomyces sp. NPDC059441]|uniref:helix-turn-helix transcriptional regulator n=1 Tax=Streptomyces sp. NPDC059441 TaxID=3346829 RepID=UPI00369E8BAB